MGKTRKSEATMLDFTSALYLGLHHPSETLRPWAQLTTGRPAALQAPPGAESITASLVRLLRCEGATLGHQPCTFSGMSSRCSLRNL